MDLKNIKSKVEENDQSSGQGAPGQAAEIREYLSFLDDQGETVKRITGYSTMLHDPDGHQVQEDGEGAAGDEAGGRQRLGHGRL